MKKYSVVNLGDLYARDLQHTFGGMKECVVIGASFGGVVGVEISRCLVRGGIAVKSLNLLDSPWPTLSESLEGALTSRALVSNLFGNSSQMTSQRRSYRAFLRPFPKRARWKEKRWRSTIGGRWCPFTWRTSTR
ncbi:hypothetical protein K443DRAFT_491447 [Laccaria amethystina LaAM-08-1]|uniref:Uncharacterized protein n=1 Tax=Laccaria amethystina LaAM-08-1 TaxID=1095629 RepID=A0A0C9WUV3_9AGAR|nr:hypothetical protein K443DRAFT_491447 [Laccaria amethystina LaAM-08-1]